MQVDNIPKEKSKEGIYLLLFISSRLMHRKLYSSWNQYALPVWNFMWNRHKQLWNKVDMKNFESFKKDGLKKFTQLCYISKMDFLLEIKCSLFFQIYTKKHLNITREQRRRNSTLNLAPCSMIYISLWSSQYWVEGLAMEVLHVGGPSPSPFAFLYLVKKTSSCNKTFKAMQLVLLLHPVHFEIW